MNFQEKDQRIEPSFSNWVKELRPPFQYDSKNGTLKKYDKLSEFKRIELFLVWLKELPLFFQCDSKNWTLFFQYDSKDWTFEVWFKELNPVFFNMTQRIELLKYDSKNWTFFLNTTHRIKDFFFSFWLKELNVTQSIESSFFNLTQRIEPFFFFQYDLKTWTFF